MIPVLQGLRPAFCTHRGCLAECNALLASTCYSACTFEPEWLGIGTVSKNHRDKEQEREVFFPLQTVFWRFPRGHLKLKDDVGKPKGLCQQVSPHCAQTGASGDTAGSTARNLRPGASANRPSRLLLAGAFGWGTTEKNLSQHSLIWCFNNHGCLKKN